MSKKVRPGRETIILRVIEAEPADRERLLAELCGDDSVLRGDIARLLTFCDSAAEISKRLENLAESVESTNLRNAPCIDGLTILGELGRGGMGTVYLAKQSEPLDRLVAVKVLHATRNTAEHTARFQGEAQALARMHHEGIAAIFDAGITELNEPYFIMEYVDGRRLTDYCDEQTLDTVQRLRLFCQICDAVQHAHESGIVHRDLKPSNVLVKSSGDDSQIKVIDFGIAKALRGRLHDATSTRGAGPLGTIEYMSPEQLFDDGVISERSDVYALGIILYELLARQTPYSEKGDEDLITRLIAGPRPLSEVSPVHSLALEAIVDRSLARSPKDRYPSVAALSDEVRRYLDGETVRAVGHARRHALRRWVRHRPPSSVLSKVGGLGAIVVLMGFLAWHGLRILEDKGHESDQPQTERTRFEDSTRVVARARQALEAGAIEQTHSLVSQYLNQMGGKDEHERSSFDIEYLRRKSELSSEPLELVQGGLDRMVFLRDGRSIAVLGSRSEREQGIVTRWSIDRIESPIQRWRIELEFPVSDMVLEPGGEFLTLQAQGEALLATVDVEDGAVRRYGGLITSGHLAYSPIGHVLVAAATTVVLHTSPPTRYFQVGNFKPKETYTGLGFSDDGRWLVVGGFDNLRLISIPESIPYGTSSSRQPVTQVLKFPVARPIDNLCMVNDVVVAAHREAGLVKYDVRQLREIRRSAPLSTDVEVLAASPDGRWLATGSREGDLTIWDQDTLVALWSVRAHGRRIDDLQFSSDSRLLASVGDRGALRFWSTERWSRLTSHAITKQRLWDVAFRDDGRLVTESEHPRFSLWDLDRERPPGGYHSESSVEVEPWSAGGIEHEVCALAPGGREVAVSTSNYTVQLVATNDRVQEIVELGKFSAPVYGMGFSRDGSLFAACSLRHVRPLVESQLMVWRRGKHRENRPLDSVRASPHNLILDVKTDVTSRRLAVFPRRGLIAIGGREATPIEVRAIADGARIGRFQAQSFVVGIVPTPDERFLATLGEDGTVEVWQIPDRSAELAPPTRELTVRCHRGRINALKFFPDGQRFVTGPAEGSVKLWRWFEEAGELSVVELLELNPPPGQVMGLDVRADGQAVVAAGGSPDGAAGWVKMWWGATTIRHNNPVSPSPAR